MSLSGLDGLLWVAGGLLLLLLAQRWLHRELQAVLLLITRRPTLTLGLFSFLFFPGVLLHETSHYLMARLVGVRTGRFSLLPRVIANGRLMLGYVETARTDPVRDSLIGTAPLLSGGAVMLYLGFNRLGLAPVAVQASAGQYALAWQSLLELPYQPDFWLWFYLAFAVSTTMLPSESDRQAWLPLFVATVLLLGLALLAGAGPWMVKNIAPSVNSGLRLLATIFGISFGLHFALLVPIFIVRLLLNRITGLQMVD